MGHYKQRGENSWLLVLELGRDALGVRNRPTKTIRIDDPAILRAPKRLDDYLKDQLVLFKQECLQGSATGPAKIGFFELVEDWEKKHVLVHLAEKTQENYTFHVNARILPHFERKWIDEITTRFISDYLHGLRSPNARIDGKGPVKSATIVYNYRVLKSIFKFAVAEKYLMVNPMIGISKPPEDDVKEMEVYDEKEIVELFLALEEEDIEIRVMVLLAVTTALRRGEIDGLEWSRIDLDNAVLFVKQTIPKFKDGQPVLKGPKRKSSVRRISLSETLVEELRNFKEYLDNQRKEVGDAWIGGNQDFLFRHSNGIPLSPNRLTKRWIEFHRRHNLKPIRLHDLRHTSVSWLIFKKVHSETIAKMVGHKNTKMLSIYGHIFDSVSQAAAATFDEIPMPKKKIEQQETVAELSPDCPPNSPTSPQDNQQLH